MGLNEANQFLGILAGFAALKSGMSAVFRVARMREMGRNSRQR